MLCNETTASVGADQSVVVWYVCCQLNVVHHDPEQQKPVVGHAAGVDRLSHNAPSIDQNSIKMSDKLKHNTQSSGISLAAQLTL